MHLKTISLGLNGGGEAIRSRTDHRSKRPFGILQARLEYISLLQIEIKTPSPTPDVRLALESELKKLEPKMKSMEGKMTELLPRPIALSPQTNKSKRVKRSAAPVVNPAKTTKSESTNDSDFVFPEKTMKPL
ncbi:hypothetical protein TNCV_4766531 [Trichonephila clavipes]|nr:hypothetical protein TNCV_4766531 [Trichonephila clavipes]